MKIWVAAVLVFFAAFSQAQVITTVVGTGVSGFSGDGGPGTAAQIEHSYGIKTDHSDNVYFSDMGNNRVRKLNSAGIISTVAGGGSFYYAGDGGAATTAGMSANALAIYDRDGITLYFCDLNGRIRKVRDGIITTLAGRAPAGYSGDGGPATAAQITTAYGVATDTAGNVYITNGVHSRTRRIGADGIINTVAGNGTLGWSGDGGPATAAGFYDPYDIFIDKYNNLYITDVQRLRKVDALTGIITTIAGTGLTGYSGDGGPATAANVYGIEGVTVDDCGNVFISESTGDRVRVINTLGIISTVAGTGVAGYAGDGGSPLLAQFSCPNTIALDQHGSLYVADMCNYRIRKITYGTHPPAFVHGGMQALEVCSGTTVHIDTMLAAIDSDNGQQEAWKVVQAPAHGTLNGVWAATSTGGVLTPSGLTYAALPGYSGTDTFRVQVSDCGTGTAVTTVAVHVANCALGMAGVPASGQLRIAPNPGHGHYVVTAPGAAGETVRIRITSLTGQLIKTLECTAGIATPIDVNVPAGLYVLTAASAAGAETVRIVVE